MSQTAAPTPAASIRGDPDPANRTSPWNSRPPRREAGSAGTGGFAIPEGKVSTHKK